VGQAVGGGNDSHGGSVAVTAGEGRSATYLHYSAWMRRSSFFPPPLYTYIHIYVCKYVYIHTCIYTCVNMYL